jgi:hypothetical protein
MRLILTAVISFGAFDGLAQTAVPKSPEPTRFYKAPEHVPAWLEGHQNLLPPVDEVIINDMANLLNSIRMIGEGVSPEYAKYEDTVRKARQRAGELHEKAAYAILHLYTYEDPVSRFTDNMRSHIVDKIWRDPTILEYTLPFFRQRVTYLVEQFRAGDTFTPDNTPIGSSELQVVVGYLQTWGDESDKKPLRELLKLMKAKGDYYVSGWAAEAMQMFERNIAAETAEYSSKKNTHMFHIKTSDYHAHGHDRAYALPSSTYKPPAAASSANTSESTPGPDKIGNSPAAVAVAVAVAVASRAADWRMWFAGASVIAIVLASLLFFKRRK